jgi:hypothetical protein
LLWLSFLRTPLPAAGAADQGPDSSFYQSYGYFLKNRLQAGKDYIFTFGPLGYFYRSAYDSDLYWYVYAWQLGIKLVLAVVVAQTIRRVQGFPLRLLALLAIAGPALLLEWFPDTLYVFCFFLVFANAAADSRPTLWGLVPATLVMAALSLMKFNLFLFAPLVILCLSLHLWLAGRQAGAVLLPGLFGLAVCGLWLLLGQSLANLPAYLRTSLEMSGGYTQAMAKEAMHPLVTVIAGLTALALLASLTPLSLAGLARARRSLDARGVAVVALLVVGAFLAWKQAPVRNDGPWHTPFFFTFTLPVPFLLPTLLPALAWREPARVSVLSACAVLSAVGILGSLPTSPHPARLWTACREQLAGRLHFALAPGQVRALLEAMRALTQQQAALPGIQARIQGEAIDIISFKQGLLFLNNLGWKPRPLFQSHGAYVPRLARLNAQLYRSADAPRFVILKLEPIDNRFPASEDGPTLLEIFRRYRPVLAEKGYLLLERYRGPGAEDAAPAAVLEKTVQFGEEVALDQLPDGCYTLTASISTSLGGKVREALYKLPNVMIRVRTSRRGEQVFRLIPSMAQTGFLLSPLLMDADDVQGLYTGAGRDRVQAFTVLSAEPQPVGYENKIHIVLKRFPGPDRSSPATPRD